MLSGFLDNDKTPTKEKVVCFVHIFLAELLRTLLCVIFA